MSGESTVPGASRFGLMTKKFSSSPKSPVHSNPVQSNRNVNARARLLNSKVSAPRPINLPSLRRENAGGSEWPSLSTSVSASVTTASSTGSGNIHSSWGSSATTVALTLTSAKRDEPAEQPSTVTATQPPSSAAAAASAAVQQDTPSDTKSTSTKPHTAAHDTQTVKPNVQPSSQSNVSPKQGEQAEKDGRSVGSTGKDNLLHLAESTAIMRSSGNSQGDHEHLSWDEMVLQDLAEKAASPPSENTSHSATTQEDSTVAPSDRFAEDYDRSYPPQIRHVRGDTWQRDRDRDRDRDRHNQRQGPSWRGGRSSWVRGAWSSDQKTAFQPTVLQRPRGMSEDHNGDSSSSPSTGPTTGTKTVAPDHDHSAAGPDLTTTVDRPPEVTSVQREVMLTAAERAKKRRDEEEAAREAMRERARKKAEAIAAMMAESESANSSSKAATSPSDASNTASNTVSNDVSNDASSTSPSASPSAPSASGASDAPNASPNAASTDTSADAPTTVSTAAHTAAPTTTPSSANSSLVAKSSSSSATNRTERQLDADDEVWNAYVHHLRDKRRWQDANMGPAAWNSYATRQQGKESDSKQAAATEVDHKSQSGAGHRSTTTANDERSSASHHQSHGGKSTLGWHRTSERGGSHMRGTHRHGGFDREATNHGGFSSDEKRAFKDSEHSGAQAMSTSRGQKETHAARNGQGRRASNTKSTDNSDGWTSTHRQEHPSTAWSSSSSTVPTGRANSHQRRFQTRTPENDEAVEAQYAAARARMDWSRSEGYIQSERKSHQSRPRRQSNSEKEITASFVPGSKRRDSKGSSSIRSVNTSEPRQKNVTPSDQSVEASASAALQTISEGSTISQPATSSAASAPSPNAESVAENQSSVSSAAVQQENTSQTTAQLRTEATEEMAAVSPSAIDAATASETVQELPNGISSSDSFEPSVTRHTATVLNGQVSQDGVYVQLGEADLTAVLHAIRSRQARHQRLLKADGPLFPEAFQRLPSQIPANLRFTVDTTEAGSPSVTKARNDTPSKNPAVTPMKSEHAQLHNDKVSSAANGTRHREQLHRGTVEDTGRPSPNFPFLFYPLPRAHIQQQGSPYPPAFPQQSSMGVYLVPAPWLPASTTYHHAPPQHHQPS